MKLETINNDSKRVLVDAGFGCKMGYSPYLVSERSNPTQLDEIVSYFVAPTIEDAIKKIVRAGMLNEEKPLYLITGDGQEIRLTVEGSLS